MDTSTILSALMGGWWTQVTDAIADGRLEIVASEDLLAEFADASLRPRIRDRITPEEAASVRHLLAEKSLFFLPAPIAEVSRDPRDDYLLGLAGSSHSNYLVSRDEDLLVLKEYHGVQIIYPARFLQLLQAAR